MEELNHALFLSLNASAHPAALTLLAAKVFAEYAIWLVPAMLGIGWLRGDLRNRRIMLEAALSATAGLLANQAIALFWQHPRPFMIGLGHTYLAHVADSSFPSDHLTLLWSVGFCLLMHASTRRPGAMLALLGLPVAWARIYLGVHYPFDMAGAALVAFSSAWLSCRKGERIVDVLYGLATPVHRRLFAVLIRRGWAQK